MRRTLTILLMLMAGALWNAAHASACDPGSWYQPDHQVCAPYPPPYSPGYNEPPNDYPYPPNHPPSRWNQ